jgi:Tfp pilus assembly protein PilO
MQTLLIMIVLIVVLLLALGWWIATRVKREIDADDGPGSAASRSVQVTAGCAARLAALSREPVLLKRVEGDLSIQLGDKPMTKLASVPDRNARSALREAAVALDVQFGQKWTAIVRVAGTTALSVTRIA